MPTRCEHGGYLYNTLTLCFTIKLGVLCQNSLVLGSSFHTLHQDNYISIIGPRHHAHFSSPLWFSPAIMQPIRAFCFGVWGYTVLAYRAKSIRVLPARKSKVVSIFFSYAITSRQRVNQLFILNMPILQSLSFRSKRFRGRQQRYYGPKVTVYRNAIPWIASHRIPGTCSRCLDSRRLTESILKLHDHRSSSTSNHALCFIHGS